MRITNEADYALRIVYALLECERKSAKMIAADTGVSLRFSLKILRKLSQAGIVESVQGAAGGYFLTRKPGQISVGEVVEAIDGALRINSCIEEGFVCTRVGGDTSQCCIHCFFEKLNEEIARKMRETTFDQLCSGTAFDK